jgi:SAM-dependent MidA family methyltransferase
VPSELVEHLQKRISSQGPHRFRDYMEEALYHPRYGYYSSSKNPIGFQGDFFTASDLDPIFGRILGERFALMARNTSPFTIVELGAGKGLLARHILEYQQFPYLILERSAAMRKRQQETLKGLAVDWIDDLPEKLQGCIFSNEFFDALPVHRVVRRGDGLKEIYVDEKFKEIEKEPTPDLMAPLELIREGQVVDLNMDARMWIRRIAESLESGYHLAIDYGYLRDEFYAQPSGTLMCYWQHQAIEDPYVHIGEQDMTAHVNFSDLIDAGAAAGLRMLSFKKQIDFLIDAGILETLQKLGTAGDAASTQRLVNIKKLILPGSMGDRFKVLIQKKG